MAQKTSLSTTWSSTGNFDGSPYITSLRGKDPKRTSTTTIHLPQNIDSENRCPGIRSHHFGPSHKIVGGYLVAINEDQLRVSLPRSLDPAEILSMHLHRPATAPTSLASTAQSPGRSEFPTAARPGTTSVSPFPGSGGSRNRVNKVVFWDGKNINVMDKPDLEPGEEWAPPHLKAKDVEPGHFLGVGESTGQAGTALIGGKARLLPDTSLPLNATWTGTNIMRRPGLSGPVPPPYGPMKGTYGLPPYAPINGTSSFGTKGNIDGATLRVYAREKLMGFRESEGTRKSQGEVTAWKTSRCYLTSSMEIGHQYRLAPTPQEARA